jgi:ketosteroid isomerase-like protein
MKRSLILLCVLFIGLSAISTNSLFANTGTAEKEIRELEDKMNAAYAKNDLPAYFAYYADDFVQWLPEGRTDLAKYKKDWTAYVEAGNKVQGVEIRELTLRVDAAEDSAVASYTLYVKTKLADGKITQEENQETDVWFKRNGTWKVVALHYSPAAKK